jgi:hypothetical protein
MATPFIYGAIIGSSGGPVGTILGIAVGLSFYTGEIIYDEGKPLINRLIHEINFMENSLRSGRIPSLKNR